MIETIEQLKAKRPDLVELFEGMNREQLLEQIYKESKDAINMEERVSLFMEHCTIDMSKTTYTLESLKTLIQENKEAEISDFCADMLEDISDMSKSEIVEYLYDRIRV